MHKLPIATKRDRSVICGESFDICSVDQRTTLISVFRDISARFPTRVAVMDTERQLSYAELAVLSDRLAENIRNASTRQMAIGLLLERSVDLIVGLFGILKAGAAYVPIEPSLPEERMRALVSEARMNLVVTENPHADRVRALGVTPLSIGSGLSTSCSNSLAEIRSAADSLAYIIFTSGSTGRPKGVPITHRSILRLFSATNRWFRFHQNDVWTMFHSVAFDFSVWEIFGALLHGGCLVVVPKETTRDPIRFHELVQQYGVTILNQTPSAFREHVRVDMSRDYPRNSLRAVIFGGERLDFDILRPWITRRGDKHPRLTNMYGITETTVHATYYCVQKADLADSSRSRIGRPIDDLEVSVRDPQGNIVPVGTVGELYVCGPGLSRGYINRPELTATAFPAHPERPGYRMYKTGDLVRQTDAETLEYVGRTDRQVKIRGHRVELGDLEAQLKSMEGISQAVVHAWPGEPSPQLVAYVVPDGKGGDAHYQGVRHWAQVFEHAYRVEKQNPPKDATSNFVGWNNSASGERFGHAEMLEWVTSSVAWIRAYNPERVLEIGCGMGLLVFRLAASVRRYVATDISRLAVDHVRRHSTSLPVTVLEREAADFRGFERGQFDTIVLNSVAQYFPNREYLDVVIARTIDIVGAGGTILVGDVRSLPLARAFYADIVEGSVTPGMSCGEFVDRVTRHVLSEHELLVDPYYFASLVDRYDAVSNVAITPKRGRCGTEMNRFRYDVAIEVGEKVVGRPLNASGTQHFRWGRDVRDEEELVRRLSQEPEKCFYVTDVRNSRIQRIASALVELQRAESSARARDVLNAVGAGCSGVDPGGLYDVVLPSSHRALVEWPHHDGCGRFDVLYYCERMGRRHALATLNGIRYQRRAPERTTSDPVMEWTGDDLALGVRRALAARVPDYMLPSTIEVLRSLPMTINGKIDTSALREPRLRRVLVPADDGAITATEKVMSAVFCEVLRVDGVGLDQDFFELGGDSLSCLRVVAEAAAAGVNIGVADIFRGRTIRKILQGRSPM